MNFTAYSILNNINHILLKTVNEHELKIKVRWYLDNDDQNFL